VPKVPVALRTEKNFGTVRVVYCMEYGIRKD